MVGARAQNVVGADDDRAGRIGQPTFPGAGAEGEPAGLGDDQQGRRGARREQHAPDGGARSLVRVGVGVPLGELDGHAVDGAEGDDAVAVAQDDPVDGTVAGADDGLGGGAHEPDEGGRIDAGGGDVARRGEQPGGAGLVHGVGPRVGVSGTQVGAGEGDAGGGEVGRGLGPTGAGGGGERADRGAQGLGVGDDGDRLHGVDVGDGDGGIGEDAGVDGMGGHAAEIEEIAVAGGDGGGGGLDADRIGGDADDGAGEGELGRLAADHDGERGAGDEIDPRAGGGRED